MSSWWELLLCGRIISESGQRQRRIDDLTRQLDTLNEKYTLCKDELSQEKAQNRQLRRDLGNLERENSTLQTQRDLLLEEVAELEGQVDKLEEDSKWYVKRLKTLESALEDAIVIPEIELADGDLTPYSFDGWPFGDYDTKIADREYYLLPYDKWIEILTPIQQEVKAALGAWRPEVSDCDDFAYVMGASVTQFIANARVSRQGAFMVVWDITGTQRHAYNAFMDDEGNVWIYEPQNGNIVGKLGETTGAYESNWIWFMGKAA